MIEVQTRTEQSNVKDENTYLPPANKVWGKVICLQACVCPQGGVPDQVHPLGPGTPLGADSIPQEQTPPSSRHPREQTPPKHPPGADTPQEQTPPRADTRPEQTPGVDTPRSRHPLSGADPPRADTPPPWEQTPRHRACWEIRSTHGRYASYWNAILL